ncbi:MAG TPA: 2-amino-4-hydroxy-6-hydroxymethyldihydropteridine diphosphokinase [Flavihumibacter sp.]|nr:2-amino-4-hydroxy-6-hydroxymethyldihydropteridine diphosphokinase [Bacteroidota bacterium]HOA37243.1 2-amino-4-hydroxy-6-hydroxymethyldihydropteridine diphosphokinase [Flavihumibacter sp.]HPZ87413.1 2-amino-4-hydroxy-6-hydroxymethyldihydropteridine diphosphokinase [Flavihumibacter sp.]HQD10845.1 2-amino-4-hydroxy-6-hydroxymethyldihydropteridine diphosphokinase [Flavihumibacter sp.]
MHTAYLLLGGNMGNRLSQLSAAAGAIERQLGKLSQRSAVYETAAWGKEDEPPYLNQVLVLQTTVKAPALMTALLAIEHELGRERRARYGARVIDIDILYYDDLVLHTAHVQLPHPRLSLRRFALVPLAEVAAAKKDPVDGRTVAELLRDCPDKLPVKKYTESERL